MTRKRYDYRNDYKNMSKENLLHELEVLKDRFLDTYLEDTKKDCGKRISYIRGKLEKLEVSS